MGAARKLIAADLFCGGGGTSRGFALACEEAGIKNMRLIAINHWKLAIDTHAKNHPWAEHHCARVDQLDPRKLVPGGRLNILVASPECSNHANARGGRPVNDQSRATAWDILKWLQELYVENVLIENVREIMDWGPIGANKRPLKSRKGELFYSWIDAIRKCGYRVDYKILNAADFGDATTRQRFFLLARRGNHRIVWPEQTHSKDADKTGDLFKGLKPWRAAREIIDWNLKGESIFNRKKPLAQNTLARIEAGLRKFGGAASEPFIVMLRGTEEGQLQSSVRAIGQPLPTVTAEGKHLGLCEPFTVGLEQTGSNSPQVRRVGDPIPSVTTAGRIGLCQPFILQQQSGGAPRSTEQPLPAIASKGAQALVQPFIVSAGGPEGQGRNPKSIEAPLGTVMPDDHKALVEPFLITFYGERNGQTPRTHDIGQPLPVQPASSKFGLVEPFLVKYFGTGRAQSIEKPVPAITTKDRCGLVETRAHGEPKGVVLDILFRMLEPHELARAMGFEGYEFKGKRKDQIKMIGNAVCVNMAKALVKALLEN